jgi:hypothetical protein
LVPPLSGPFGGDTVLALAATVDVVLVGVVVLVVVVVPPLPPRFGPTDDGAGGTAPVPPSVEPDPVV